ncbi:MAG: hypothetical protein II603_09120, partial [Muribaculaceae bacterium]|nr:hypothetical protein [Muribaculaceae bacterium]
VAKPHASLEKCGKLPLKHLEKCEGTTGKSMEKCGKHPSKHLEKCGISLKNIWKNVKNKLSLCHQIVLYETFKTKN